jgi:hypothetical protein
MAGKRTGDIACTEPLCLCQLSYTRYSRARTFSRFSKHSVHLRSFVGRRQLNDKMAAYFALPEQQSRYEDSVEHVEIELGPEKANLEILRESLWKE